MGFVSNAVGARRRSHYLSDELAPMVADSPDEKGSEYFEWESVRKAIDTFQGERPFVFVELGAGYGRWCVNAVCMLRAKHQGAAYRLVAAEPDRTHFRWLKQHFADNGIRRDWCRLCDAPVSGSQADVYFIGGQPRAWYGQAVVDDAFGKMHLGFLRRFLGKQYARRMRTVTLAELLEGHDVIDLIDMDIQGAELGVIETSLGLLRQRARRLHISTHSRDIGYRLNAALRDWEIEHAYPCLGESETSIGCISFGDGVIAARNPFIP